MIQFMQPACHSPGGILAFLNGRATSDYGIGAGQRSLFKFCVMPRALIMTEQLPLHAW